MEYENREYRFGYASAAEGRGGRHEAENALQGVLTFYNERQAHLVKSMGHEIDTGWRVDDDKIDEYRKKMQEVIDVEVADEIEPVKIPVDENVKLSYQDLCLLRGLIELEAEE